MGSVAKRLINSCFGFLLALALFGGWALFPLHQKLKFGIALGGGTYVTLRVQVQKALEAELKDKCKEIASESKEQNLPEAKSYAIDGSKLVIYYENQEQVAKLKDSLNNLLQ